MGNPLLPQTITSHSSSEVPQHPSTSCAAAGNGSFRFVKDANIVGAEVINGARLVNILHGHLNNSDARKGLLGRFGRVNASRRVRTSPPRPTKCPCNLFRSSRKPINKVLLLSSCFCCLLFLESKHLWFCSSWGLKSKL